MGKVGNALVLVRPTAAWNYTTYDDTTGVTISLPTGNTYVPLNSDGTFGAAVSSITLRNAESAILIKQGSGDTQAPSVPANLSAQATSSSQINLSWTASTDNIAVTGYRIYRNAAQIDTSPTNSYSNTGLSASTTYTYSVSAYDAAGNVSAQSSSVSATTSSGGSGGSSGGDSSVSGGSGCGYIKDYNGKGPRAKGEGLAFAIILIITLAGIALRRIIAELKMRRVFSLLNNSPRFFVVAILFAQIAACGGGSGGTSNSSDISSGGSGGDTGSGVAATLLLTTTGQYYTLLDDLTTAGTAVSISANDVTLDLNGKTITYNASSSGSRVYGVYAAVGVTRVTIKNGTILQGSGNTADSPAIYIYGASWSSGHKISDVVIRTTGFQSNGIQADNGYGFNSSEISRAYVEVHGDTTALDGYGGDPITVGASNTGGIQIHDSVLVAGHRGIYASSIGSSGTSNLSRIYNNRVQQVRRKGSKAPYGILVGGRSHNIDVYDNQIISDDGRGIIMDGWGMGVSSGASGNRIYRNRIDVLYSSQATTGGYVENNVYGIRDRYASGDNTFEDNIVIVSSDIAGQVHGFYIGSDGPDALMKNIIVNNNTIIARRGLPANIPYAFRFDYADSVSITGNRYATESGFTTGTNLVTTLTNNNNTVLAPAATTPAAPTGLAITRFLNSYLIAWNANSEADVYEYVLYRDGVKLLISPRGGTFYVDVGIGGSHNYSVSALTLTGVEGAQSAAVSTNTAKNGWW